MTRSVSLGPSAQRSRLPLLLLALSIASGVVAAACAADEQTLRPRKGTVRKETDPETGKELPDFNDINVKEKEGTPDPFEGMPKGTAQNDALCARAGNMADDTNPQFNAVTNFLCKERTSISSIKDLQKALGIAFTKTDRAGTNGSNNNPGFAFLANSSSLVARAVSAINPRVFVFQAAPGQPARIPGYVVMGFARGENFVEIAAESPKGGNKLSLYLVKFDLGCEGAHGLHDCKNGDLFTPEIEKNWKGITVYDDEDLKNTLLDCRHCHQPGGPSQKLMLRMQELEDPWTHWFRNDRPGGITLLQDYFRAHGELEEYGGVPGVLIHKSDGRALEDVVKGQGFQNQPNGFNSKTIEQEIKASSSAQPEINTPRGSSATWNNLYARAMAGEFIPPPYHDVKVTDPNKLQIATDEYKRYVAGDRSTDMPDIRRVFLDDALEAMTFKPKLGISGREVLVQTCAQCHNPNLDQSITRAKFDVMNLDSMSREEKDLAIARLKMGSANRLRMPPVMMRSLPDDAREAAIKELEK